MKNFLLTIISKPDYHYSTSGVLHDDCGTQQTTLMKEPYEKVHPLNYSFFWGFYV